MIRRPPRSTRTDTLFPYTTLFRSLAVVEVRMRAVMIAPLGLYRVEAMQEGLRIMAQAARFVVDDALQARAALLDLEKLVDLLLVFHHGEACLGVLQHIRSDARRVGKECDRSCRSRWSP